MGRIGIRYEDVVCVAKKLQAEGRSSTIEAIRQVLGSGSSSTIAPYLKKWKAEQEKSASIADQHNIPLPLLSMIKDLWNNLSREAEAKINHMCLEHKKTLVNLQHALETSQDANMQWEAQYKQLTHENERLCCEKNQIKEAYDQAEQEKNHYILECSNMLQTLNEKNDRLNELQQLQQQSQLNLEHYREAAREQRLLDQAHYTKQQQQLEARFTEQQRQFKEQQQEYRALQKEFEKHATEKQKITLDYQQSQFHQEQLQHALNHLEKKYKESLDAEKHWQASYQLLQKESYQQDKTLGTFEKKLATLSKQLELTIAQHQKLTEENQIIQAERWQLAQEKAELDGQLKQMKVMLDYYLNIESLT